MIDYKKLQNGSDIRGVAMEGVAGQAVNLTSEVVRNIGAAFVLYLRERLGKDALRISIGRDSRLTGEAMYAALSEGVRSMGADVTNFHLASTPAMFMSTVTEPYCFDGAMMITASHLPFNRNGVKFFVSEGGLEKQDIKKILALAEARPQGDFPYGREAELDFLSIYAEGLCDYVRKQVQAEDYLHPLDGFSIVVDAGNGAGGFYADRVLVPLGATITGSQFLEPDGTFPNHAPNPEDATAMQAITDCVKRNRADLGLIFDTDVDRAGAVLGQGMEINRNRLIALMSAIVLEENPGSTIVTDSITSTGLKDFIERHGGIHHRFKRGYRNVINESIRLNREGIHSELAIETSGHGALKENYFLDDGAFLVTKLLVKMAQLKREGKDLLSLMDGLSEPLESREVRMPILAENFAEVGQEILTALSDYANENGWHLASPNYEGVRVEFPINDGAGWFLLRMSLHDPLLPLNIESDVTGGVRCIASKLLPFLSRFDALDTSGLTALV